MSTPMFLSTTLPYVNGNPHLGHAFEYVQADAYARHARRRGDDVLLVSGTDENSLRNVQAARADGLAVGELVARRARTFEDLLGTLSARPDRFVRTGADPVHAAGAAELWNRIAARGDLYARDYEGMYCDGCEQFRTADELPGGRCPVHKRAPVRVTERNYFFRLSRYRDALVAALTDGRITITPASRAQEALAVLSGGLDDISVSRSARRAEGWGIPVPGDPDQVMYVWFDALTSYVNAVGGPVEVDRGARHWNDPARRVHLLGKDVLRFHAIYWPAMLLSAGLPLPSQLVVHGHITAAGQKISKTAGNGPDVAGLITRYGADPLRFYLLADFSPWADTDFTETRLTACYNTDFANGLGNLVNRVTTLLHRHRGGVVPGPGTPGTPEYALAAATRTAAGGVRDALDRFDHRQAVAHIRALSRRTDACLSERAPWHLATAGTESSDRLFDAVLHTVTGALDQLTRLIEPIVPGSAAAMAAALGRPAGGAAGSELTGRLVARPAVLFPRLEVYP
ncbi:methionine--tRNA ligase [Actinoplanes sp. N902-109]|uniref:methionine--tRNA ligase n=1 Tax=Actinoplanes sp. (strain N902-109) TaxID=649831 RepID=UPI000329656F|nr:methionine--tRNA ligase [Actinoplanes sp. N902-109]AGL19161.1 methionyl-tRNA synthetase [Actinoplanes sp. N902-109]